MSAELLREAAEVLREHAEAATPGPWTMRDGWGPQNGFMACRSISNDEHLRVLWAEGHHDQDAELIGRRASFEYIALMCPPVALALADLLESDATYYHLAYDDNADLSDMDNGTQAAVTLARAILRRSE